MKSTTQLADRIRELQAEMAREPARDDDEYATVITELNQLESIQSHQIGENSNGKTNTIRTRS